MKTLFIFRRDFRLVDNTALNECCKLDGTIYPIFIFTPEQIKDNKYKSDNAIQFMIDSLKYLDKKINITFFFGNYLDVLQSIIKKYEINNIFTNTDYTKYSIEREDNIKKFCNKNNINFQYFHDICLIEPGTVLTSTGTPFKKFTPFYKKYLSLDIPDINKYKVDKTKFDKLKTSYKTDLNKISDYYQKNDTINIIGGRKKAKKIIKNIQLFKNYQNTRNIINLETTNLSGYLKFGCISIREVYHRFKKEFGKNNDIIKQLIWRDFYYHLGYNYSDRFGKSLKDNYDNIKWIKNNDYLKAWQEGKTGYPIVDACMTQLNTTGYMHNRGRLITASFLVKNLNIDWKEGEKYFANKLLDYDVLVNNGNWQWVSGSGADSMPYFRIFNPWLQSKKFDKDAEYIKLWLPNLEDIESGHLHQWDKYYDSYSLDEIEYYEPIINYKESRDNTLELYKKYL